MYLFIHKETRLVYQYDNMSLKYVVIVHDIRTTDNLKFQFYTVLSISFLCSFAYLLFLKRLSCSFSMTEYNINILSTVNCFIELFCIIITRKEVCTCQYYFLLFEIHISYAHISWFGNNVFKRRVGTEVQRV